MENDQDLKQQLTQLRSELMSIHDKLGNAELEIRALTFMLKECLRGFKTISETGNTRVADVFIEELKKP